MFLEASELAIHEMELETMKLRDYLRSLKLLSEDEYRKAHERDVAARKELSSLKVS